MNDLTRFALAWMVLLALVAIARLLGPLLVAQLLARAFRHFCRSDRHVA